MPPEVPSTGENPAQQGMMSRLEEILSRAKGMFGAPQAGEGLVSRGTAGRPGGPPPQMTGPPPVPIPGMPGMVPQVSRPGLSQGERESPEYQQIPTSFPNEEARRGSIVQGALSSMAQFTSKLSQERVQKRSAEAKALATAFLTGDENTKKLISEGKSSNKVIKAIQAMTGSDLEARMKYAGTAEGRGIQDAVNEVTARRQQAEDRAIAAQKAQSEEALRLSQQKAEEARAGAEAARQQKESQQLGTTLTEGIGPDGKVHEFQFNVESGKFEDTGIKAAPKEFAPERPERVPEEALFRESWLARPENKGKTAADFNEYKLSLSSKSAEALSVDAYAKGIGKKRDDLTPDEIGKAIEPINQVKSDIAQQRATELMDERLKRATVTVWKPGAKAPSLATKEDALKNNWPQASAAVGAKVLAQEAGFDLVDDRIKAIKGNLSAWDDPGFHASLVLTLDASEEAYKNYLKGKVFGLLPPKSQNLIFELRNLRDDIGTMRGQLGSMSQRTQRQFEVYMAQLPGPTTPDSAAARRALDSFQMTIDHLRKGVLDLGQDDIDLGAPTGAGGGGGAEDPLKKAIREALTAK